MPEETKPASSKEPPKKEYRVRKGMVWGTPPLKEGETVELTEAEAAGFLDLLIAVDEVEEELEAETGKDFAKTGAKPPTLAETDKPAPADAPKVPRKP